MNNLVNQSTVSQHYLLYLVLVGFFLSSVNMFDFFLSKNASYGGQNMLP